MTSPSPEKYQALRRLIMKGDKVLTCDGHGLKRVTESALKWLMANYQMVNALNVFPVPDGDTGTNMLLTMQTAWKEIENKSEPNAGKVAHAVAHGALMGARGNSGVILSQIWRGFARSIGDQQEFNAADLAKAMREATDTAYRGVVKPVEGTILTVSKDAAVAAEVAVADSDDLLAILEHVVDGCRASVAKTPELLPVLKQAGVVDSGGQGLTVLLEGMLRYATGQPLDAIPTSEYKPLDLSQVGVALEAVEPGQDWEVVVDFRPQQELDLPWFYGELEKIGTSLQVGAGDNLYRVHVHLPKDRRQQPIDLAESLGTVVNIHMENLLAQMDDIQQGTAASAPKVNLAEGQIVMVVVSPGPGFDEIFSSQSAVAIVSGGQTMNPSTADILAAFEDLPTDRAIILPNNKNIQLAAEQAAAHSQKKVKVIPTRTVPQGIAAMLAFNPDGDLDEVAASMQGRMNDVVTGEVTTATRTVELNGVSVAEGQIIGLHNGQLACAGSSPDEIVIELLKRMNAADRELLTLYYGNGLAQVQASACAAAAAEAFGNLEIEIHRGGQQHYHYIFSLE
ncbi:MAG TPA: DAK2 domain-containing protein [Anaerolineales bacterium]|nr:DAK2 domain-containing protein [Anaerolineales bacterium]